MGSAWKIGVKIANFCIAANPTDDCLKCLYLCNAISSTGQMTSTLYWIQALEPMFVYNTVCCANMYKRCVLYLTWGLQSYVGFMLFYSSARDCICLQNSAVIVQSVFWKIKNKIKHNRHLIVGIILWMHPANERRHYNVTSSPISLVHSFGVFCEFYVWSMVYVGHYIGVFNTLLCWTLLLWHSTGFCSKVLTTQKRCYMWKMNKSPNVSAMLCLSFILRWLLITMGCVMYLCSRKYVAAILFLLYYKTDIRLIYPYVVPNLNLTWITSSGQQKVVQNHFLWDKFCQKLRTCFWLNQCWLMVIWEPWTKLNEIWIKLPKFSEATILVYPVV